MNPRTTWVYSDPSWWIDQIASVCNPDLEPRCGVEAPNEYFTDLNRRWECTLRYIAGTPNLNPEDVRRSLFFAKALRKWRLDVPGLTAADRARAAQDGFALRNIAAADKAYVPALVDEMRRLLRLWLPEVGSDGIHGKFGPGAVYERIHHPERFCRLGEWVRDGGSLFEELPFGHTDVYAHVCRLCAVPKDYAKDRLITVEPVYATFVQQRVRSILLESVHAGPLRGSAMDLAYTDGQAIQRRLARKGSRTGKLATLDLSDASDRVSWAAVQAVFPPWVLSHLWYSRTPYYAAPAIGVGPTQIEMFAGMGNATTFVVETLFFSAYVIAFCATYGFKPWVSVFGDDIVTTSEAAEALIERGIAPFFKINPAKSFVGSQKLRESCGIFAYEGEDVTVPKVDGYPDSYVGALGVADLHARLVASADIFQHALASRIARVGLLPNWPFRIHRYPSVTDWTADFDALPKTRQNRRYQYREAAVSVPTVQTVAYPADDRLAARENTPAADTWYQATLLGCIGLDPSPKGAGCSVARFPTGKVRWRPTWARTEVPQAEVNLDASHESADVAWKRLIAEAPRPALCRR